MAKQKRTLPSHVDGRIMIGPFHWLQFIKWLPMAIGIIASVFLNIEKGPAVVVLGILGLAVTALPFLEIRYRENGYQFLKRMITHEINGAQKIERSFKDVPIHHRFIQNEKARQYREKNTRSN